MLQRPDAVIATTVTGEAVVRVVSSDQAGEAVVIATGLDALPEDLAYQLWLIDDEGPTSSGLFDVSSTGDGEQVLAGGVGDAIALGISVEPAGGSEAPTTTPVAVVELPSA